MKTTISILNRSDALGPGDPEYQLLVAAGTLSRSPCKSETKWLASARAFPVALTEQGLLSDQRRGCFHEPLDVGATHSLTVGLLLLLLPAFLFFESFGHDAGQFLLGLQYQTCCACRLNMARADRLGWTRIAQVSGRSITASVSRGNAPSTWQSSARSPLCSRVDENSLRNSPDDNPQLCRTRGKAQPR